MIVHINHYNINCLRTYRLGQCSKSRSDRSQTHWERYTKSCYEMIQRSPGRLKEITVRKGRWLDIYSGKWEEFPLQERLQKNPLFLCVCFFSLFLYLLLCFLWEKVSLYLPLSFRLRYGPLVQNQLLNHISLVNEKVKRGNSRRTVLPLPFIPFSLGSKTVAGFVWIIHRKTLI